MLVQKNHHQCTFICSQKYHLSDFAVPECQSYSLEKPIRLYTPKLSPNQGSTAYFVTLYFGGGDRNLKTYFNVEVNQLVKRNLVKIQDQMAGRLQAELLFDNMFCPNFECHGILSLNTKIGALFACVFHLVTDCQEVLYTQSVTEISIPSFIDEVFKFTYLIAETTQVNVNAQN